MIFPRPIKAVIFDMDGLLFDTERLYADGMALAARQMGAVLSDDIVLATIGLPAPNCNAIWREHFGADFDVDAFWATSSQNFHSLAETELRLKPGVLELLERLDEQQLPRAIATSTARPTVDLHLAKFGLAERFDAIAAHGDYAQGKPHPDPYLLAARLLGIEPANCLALEDSQNGVRSAAAAGAMTIMVPDLVPATDEMQALTVHIARDLHEVRGLLG